jgi:hypothetical protein
MDKLINERIRELANAARTEVNQRLGYNDQDRANAFEEKFTELLVLECVDTIKSNQWAKDNQAFSKGMNYSAELVKEHFGVEDVN